MKRFITLGMLITNACGYSPLLNHTTPNRVSVETNSDTSQQSLNCRFFFKLQNYCADFEWVKEPMNSEDEGSMKIYFWRPEQPTVFVSPSAMVGVKLWMTSMGHGSRKVTVRPALNADGKRIPGVFDATEVTFVMAGDWDIYLQLKDAAGAVVASEKVPYYAN